MRFSQDFRFLGHATPVLFQWEIAVFLFCSASLCQAARWEGWQKERGGRAVGGCLGGERQVKMEDYWRENKLIMRCFDRRTCRILSCVRVNLRNFGHFHKFDVKGLQKV